MVINIKRPLVSGSVAPGRGKRGLRGNGLAWRRGMLSGPPFAPNQLPGLQVWIDALLSTTYANQNRTSPTKTNGAVIKAIDDLSGNNVNFSTASANEWTYQTNIKNGFPALLSNALDAVNLMTAALLVNMAFTAFGAFKWVNTNGGNAYLLDTGSNGEIVASGNTLNAIQMYAGVSFQTVGVADWMSFIGVFNGASSLININGVETSGGNVGANVGNGTLTFGNFGSAGTSQLNGYCGTLGIYNRGLIAGERATLMTYLRQRYNT